GPSPGNDPTSGTGVAHALRDAPRDEFEPGEFEWLARLFEHEGSFHLDDEMVDNIPQSEEAVSPSIQTGGHQPVDKILLPGVLSEHGPNVAGQPSRPGTCNCSESYARRGK